MRKLLVLGALLGFCEQAHAAGSVTVNDPTNPGYVACVTSTGLLCTTSSGGVGPFPPTVTPTQRGGTITLGGTAQTLMAANASRKGCMVLNPIDAVSGENLFISVTGTATVTSGSPNITLAPGQSYTCTGNDGVIQTAISIIAATTAHAFEATETQ